MRDTNDERIEMVRHEHAAGDHRLAVGMMAGAALGVGLGLLLAPRKGSELRQQIKVQSTRAAHSASSGYHVAVDKAGAWAHRCRDAYDTSRHHVVDAYRGTTRYIGAVADAVTMKARTAEQPLTIRRRPGAPLDSRADPAAQSKAVAG